MKQNFLKSSFIAGAIAVSLFANAQKTNLKFNPAVGTQYNSSTVSKSLITQTIMGQEMKITATNKTSLLYDILTTGENTDLKVTYDVIDVAMESAQGSMSFSSESNDKASKSLKEIKGKSVTVSLAPDGKITKVTGAEELAKIAKGNEEIAKMFSEAAIKTTIQQSFGFYPGKELEVGDSWNNTSTVESPYKMTTKNVYKLLKVENGIATISVNSEIATDGDVSFKSQGMNMEINLTGTQSGTIEANIADGFLTGFTSKLPLNGTVKAMGMEIPMNIVTDITVTATPKK